MANAVMVSPVGRTARKPMCALHIGAKAYVKPVASNYEYGRWLFAEGFGIECATEDEMAAGWLDAEAGK